MARFKVVLKVIFSLFFVIAGIMHFVKPEMYVAMMPGYLPLHSELVYLSGALEILLGAALLFPTTSAYAAWGLILLLLAVFPANVNMALNPERWPEISPMGLLVRLPVQGLLIWWSWLYTRPSCH